MKTKTLTPKQQEILLLLYRSRFLTRNQLQALLNHKDHRRINSWLKDLHSKKYIHKISDETSFIGRMTPGLYTLAAKSKQILKDHEECQEEVLARITRKKQYSSTFIESYLLVTDLYLWLSSQVKKMKLQFFSQVLLEWHSHYLPQPLPNGYVALSETHKRTKRYFVEVIDDLVPRFVIRAKIKRYFDFKESGDWEEHTKKAFPKIIVICASERVQEYVSKRVLKMLDESYEELEFITTTSKLLRNFNNNLSIWTKVIENED